MASYTDNISNSIVWFDIPVKDIHRASQFYTEVLDCRIQLETSHTDAPIAVVYHDKDKDLGSGCLHQVDEAHLPLANGTMLYFSVEGRLDDALSKVESNGGKIKKAAHSLDEWGNRAIILDSEGNRVALHSYK